MAGILDLFPARVRFVDADGRLTVEAFRALAKVFERIGGSTGPSTTDLATSDDEDSGLEEFKHEVSKTLDGLAMLPPSAFDPFTDPLHPLAQPHDPYTDPLHPLPQEHVDVQHILTELAGLREEVTRLRAEVQGLQEGTTP
jgi:hypothetical protein